MTALFTAFLIGLAAAGIVSVVRAIVPTLWLLIKPFSCDLCMSWWTSIGLTFFFDPSRPLFVGLAAIPVSILTLKTISRLSDIGAAPPLE